MTLEPGDIVTTGTPAGVGFFRKPPVFMQAGDVIEIEARASVSSAIRIVRELTMRGALIGCGFFAQNHLNAWRDMRADGIELVAVCDVDGAKARAAAKAFDVPSFYEDAAAMLAEQSPDFVDIATQMASPRRLVDARRRRAASIIVQKPLAPDWAKRVRSSRAAEARGRASRGARELSFPDADAQAQGLASDSDAIGRPNWARIAFRTGFDVYRTQPYFHQEKRLAILDVGIHVLDLARFFLGEVVRVSLRDAAPKRAKRGRGHCDHATSPRLRARSASSNAPTRPGSIPILSPKPPSPSRAIEAQSPLRRVFAPMSREPASARILTLAQRRSPGPRSHGTLFREAC